MEGTYPVKLTTKASPTRTSYGEENPNSATVEFERYAVRIQDQSAGSEAYTSDAGIEVGGALVWIVRQDDELDGFDVDVTDPANPVLTKVRDRIDASWRLRDLTTGIWYEITSVTEMRVPAGEMRYRLHTRNSPSQSQ